MERIGLPPGTEVGGYRVMSPLGQGGMGAVYRAVDGGGAAVALKLLHPHLGADPQARERLRREVAHLQRVRHPGVARVLDAEIDSTEAFVVTELVDGVDLAAHVRMHGPMSAEELAALAEELRSALAVVHEAGVLHRDLTPGNVLVSSRGAVLIDFGIAQAAEDPRVTSVGMVVGTPGYLSPELLEGGEPSEAADWWGWAAVLAFAATGRPPFGHRPMQAVLARVRDGSPDLEGLPPRTGAALRSVLTVDPWRRLAADQVVDELRRVADGDPGLTSSDGRAGPHDGVGASTAVLAGPGPTLLLAEDGMTRVLPSRDGEQTDEPWDEDPDGGRTEVYAPGHDGPRGDGPPTYEPFDGGYDEPDLYPGEEAGEADGSVEPAPLPAPRRRVGSVLALGILLAAIGASRPGPAMAGAVALAVLARSVGLDVSAMHRRRARRGVSSGHVATAVLAWPWYLVRAVLGVLPAALVAGSVAVMLGGVGWWLLSTGRLTVAAPAAGQSAGELAGNAPWVTPALVGAVLGVALLMLWLGPMSRTTRIGARWALGAVAPGRAGAVTLVLLALAGTVAVLVMTLGGSDGVAPVDWWPWPGPPDLG